MKPSVTRWIRIGSHRLSCISLSCICDGAASGRRHFLWGVLGCCPSDLPPPRISFATTLCSANYLSRNTPLAGPFISLRFGGHFGSPAHLPFHLPICSFAHSTSPHPFQSLVLAPCFPFASIDSNIFLVFLPVLFCNLPWLPFAIFGTSRASIPLLSMPQSSSNTFHSIFLSFLLACLAACLFACLLVWVNNLPPPHTHNHRSEQSWL
ncbi:uncharacterized protein BJ171DRAFT_256758 [Polychytrium aggregatum]|uniref:uncharacterized protein n=1 Tax=Polychytrium aggregatum TaxID=110093 RepID=UPI0022FE2EEC|nr:uncharacterized protein BJ171DRAFT_256758 [Polychytrium aggregatum]KAI9207875.1 hypothetical protein BJ171DRAFT_256758 [Polychytrium aggregatum]